MSGKIDFKIINDHAFSKYVCVCVCVYIYIYIYIYVCVCVCVYMCVCVCVYIYIYVCVCIYIYIYIYIYVCVCVCGNETNKCTKIYKNTLYYKRNITPKNVSVTPVLITELY